MTGKHYIYNLFISKLTISKIIYRKAKPFGAISRLAIISRLNTDIKISKKKFKRLNDDQYISILQKYMCQSGGDVDTICLNRT